MNSTTAMWMCTLYSSLHSPRSTYIFTTTRYNQVNQHIKIGRMRNVLAGKKVSTANERFDRGPIPHSLLHPHFLKLLNSGSLSQWFLGFHSKLTSLDVKITCCMSLHLLNSFFPIGEGLGCPYSCHLFTQVTSQNGMSCMLCRVHLHNQHHVLANWNPFPRLWGISYCLTFYSILNVSFVVMIYECRASC